MIALVTRRFSFVLLLLTAFAGAQAQSVPYDASLWQTHTSLRQAVAIDASSEALWVATTGGVFQHVPATGELAAFTATQGLHGVSAQAVAYDARREVVWIGYQDGVFDRLHVPTGTVRTFRDIARTQRFASTEIHRLAVRGDSLLVATAFGLVVFDAAREEVRDTYSRLGTLAAGTPVYDAVVAPGAAGTTLYLATEDGVASAPLAAGNLQDPAAWTIERTGLPAAQVRSLAHFDGRLYVGTAAGLAVRSGPDAFSAVPATAEAVADLRVAGGALLGVTPFAVLHVAPGGAARRIRVPGYDAPTGVVGGPQGAVWISDRQGGIVSVALPPAPATEAVVQGDGLFPSGPYHGAFADLVVTDDGVLWAGGELGSAEVPGTGFYRLDPDGTWTNYTQRFFPELAGRSSFQRIYVDPLGNAWAGSSGAGLAQVTPDGAVRVYDADNSSLRPVPQFSDILIGGLGAEKDGTLWVTSRGSSSPLNQRTPDGTWTGISTIDCGTFSTAFATPDELLVDAFDQKWIIARDRFNFRRSRGLLVLDTGTDAADPTDDRCRYFSEEGAGGVGLPSTELTALAEDRDGNIWVGTEKGPALFLNSGIVAQDPAAQPIWPQLANITQNVRYLLQGVPVRDLAVDPANRLWIASDDGVRLVERREGGFEVARHFTTENAPLLSNAVQAVAVDPVTGRVYFATGQGMVSYAGDAVAAAPVVQALRVSPNPLRLVDGAAPAVRIEGLVEATDLRILTPNGEVVARLDTRGGQARWDARDLSGALVPSGVYLVVAVGRNGEGTAYGKVAVIR